MAYRTLAQLAREKHESALQRCFDALRRAAYLSVQYPWGARFKFVVYIEGRPHAVWVNCDGKFLATTPIPLKNLVQAA